MGPNAFDTLILPACRGIVPGLVVGCFMLMLGASAGVVIDLVVTVARAAAKGLDILRGQLNTRPSRAAHPIGSPHNGFRFNSGQEMLHGNRNLP